MSSIISTTPKVITMAEVDAEPPMPTLERMATMDMFLQRVLEDIDRIPVASEEDTRSVKTTSTSRSSRRRSTPYARRYRLRERPEQTKMIEGDLKVCGECDYWAYHAADLRRHEVKHHSTEKEACKEGEVEEEVKEAKAQRSPRSTPVSRRYRMRPRTEVTSDNFARLWSCSGCGYWSYKRQGFAAHKAKCSLH